MIVVSRIIQVKVDRGLNVKKKIKYQRRLSSRLAIVMFRGTPCITLIKNYILIKKTRLNLYLYIIYTLLVWLSICRLFVCVQ